MKKLVYSLFFLFSVIHFSNAQTTNYQVYSVFVVSIAKYSSWPQSDAKEFKITVLGKSKVYDELLKTTANKDIQGRKFQVTQSEEIPKDEPQIIYVSDGRSSQLNEIVKAYAGRPVMIIAEREGLFKKGANFSFVVLDNNALRFDINRKELDNRQIRISQNLVSLANETI
ncbi:hypothetical protein WSM22_13260 [Cytophagales bacterium WSM2-2]|nr:hypothetical protein WSM22_13260 [Cytophagales bacterium WSM2-2]